MMDAFARFLAQMGKSLGKGLTETGDVLLRQQELTQQFRLQSLEQLRSKLLDEFVKLKSSPVYEDLDQGQRKLVDEAMTSLLKPGAELNDAVISNALSVLSPVKKVENTYNLFQDAYKNRGPAEAGLYLHMLSGGDQGKARRIMERFGFPGEAAPQLLEIGALARRLYENNVRLSDAQLQQVNAQIKQLESQIRGSELDNQAKEILLGTLRERYALELAKLAADVEAGKANAQILQERAKRIAEEIDLDLRKKLADLGYTQAQIEQISADTQRILAQIPLIQAQTEETQARVGLVKEQAESQRIANDIARRFGVAREMGEALQRAVESVINSGITTVDAIRGILMTNGISPENGFPQERIDAIANDLSLRNQRRVKAEQMGLKAQEFEVIGKAVPILAEMTPQEAIRYLEQDADLKDMPPELKAAILKMADYQRALKPYAELKEINDLLKDMPIPRTPEDESRLLRRVYDSLSAKYGQSFANGVVGAIKAQWALSREMIELQKSKDKAEIEYKQALKYATTKGVEIDQAQLQLQRENLNLSWQQFLQTKRKDKFDMLMNLLGAVVAPGTPGGKEAVDAVKAWGDALDKKWDAWAELLANELQKSGNATCASLVKSSAQANLYVSINEGQCNVAIQTILDSHADLRETQSKLLQETNDFITSMSLFTAGVTQAQGGQSQPMSQAALVILGEALKLADVDPNKVLQAPAPRGGGTGGAGATGTSTPTGGGASGGSGATTTPSPLPPTGGVATAKTIMSNITKYGTPDALARAMRVSTDDVVRGLGIFKAVGPGELGAGGAGSDNPLQLKHKAYESIRKECANKYGSDPLLNAVCQGSKLAQRLRIANPAAYNPASYGIAHMSPKAAANRTARLDSLGIAWVAENNPKVLETAQRMRGAQKPGDVVGADIGVYYFLNFVHAFGDEIPEIRTFKTYSPEAQALLAYSLALIPPNASPERPVLRVAVKKAFELLKAQPQTPGDLEWFVDQVGALHKATNLRRLGGGK